MKKLVINILVILLCCFCLYGCTDPSLLTDISDNTISDGIIEDAGLIVHFIDVGQGDCILLESQQSFALVDAGEYSERNKVISYLSSVGVDTLDYIISTHPHSDHCGGLSEVLRNFDTSIFISPDADSDSSSWEYVLDAADERGVTCETPDTYDTYALGDATITILSPASDAIYSDLNDYSIVCMVEYENTSVLLTGDAETTVEKELLRTGYDLSADVLKCGHHGSSTSSCEEFLSAVSPSAAIISCGKDNDYGHPHDEVVAALTERNIPMWRTDLCGDIIVSTDGDKISITTESQGTAELTTGDDSHKVPYTKTVTDVEYIGNRNSKVFHNTNCSSVDAMSDKNKTYFYSREDALDSGYSPCGSCNP